MTWNYRIVKYSDGSGYGLHEVYYDRRGCETKMTAEPATFVGDTDKDVISSLVLARTDARRRPVFDEPDDWK